MKKKIAAVLLAVLVMLTGCGTQKNRTTVETQKKICVIVKAMDSTHWMSVANGLQQAAADYDVALTLLYPKTENDSETQMQMLQDAIASEPDALAVAPCDAGGAQIYMERAREKGIQTAYIDEEVEGPIIPYIGSDNVLVGEMAAKTLAQELPAGAEVAVIAGNEEQRTHTKRTQGFCEYIKNHTELVLTQVRTVGDSSIVGGRTEMAQLLENYPDLDGVFCCSAMMVLGAMQQKEAAGRSEIALVGVDTQSDALAAVRDGKILAMVSQSGYEIGYQTIAVLVAEMKGETVKICNYVENQMINQENVKEFLSGDLTEEK